MTDAAGNYLHDLDLEEDSEDEVKALVKKIPSDVSHLNEKGMAHHNNHAPSNCAAIWFSYRTGLIWILQESTRSLTSSFGSICLGSLLVAIIQFLDFVVTSLRQNNRDRGAGGAEACLLCCLDCILHVIEDIMKYFNKWASNDS